MQTTLTRRLGAGALALGLTAGVTACTGSGSAADRSPSSPVLTAATTTAPPSSSQTTTGAPSTSTATTSARSTTSATAPFRPAAQVDMRKVLTTAFDARTTSTLRVAAADTGAVTVDVDNRGGSRAVRAVTSGGKLGDAQVMQLGDDVYAKVGGVDHFMKLPKDVLVAAGFLLGPGIVGSIALEGGGKAAEDVLSTARLQRTETVAGEQMAVYTVQMDPKALPGVREDAQAKAVPVTVWLDAQQRPRKVVAARGQGDAAQQATTTVAWGTQVSIKAPADAQTLSLGDLLKLVRGLEKARPTATQAA